MLCLKKRRTYSFRQAEPQQQQQQNKQPQRRCSSASRAREERPSAGMVLTVTEDTPADMLAGSMELLVQMPRDHHVQTQRVTVQRSTPMMDLLVQIATAHKLAASSYTLQAIGERGLVLPHQPNTPIGALDALQVKLLPKQASLLPRKARPNSQPFETTFRLQVHLPRNQLYVSRVSPKTILSEILQEVCREKNLDRDKYELRHPANLTQTLDPRLTLHDYQLQEVTLYPRQHSRSHMGSALSSQDIMALQKQEECRRQQARHSVFGFIFKKSKESSHSLSTDSLGTRSVSPARSDETPSSPSPLADQQQLPAPQQAPPRPHRKRRPAPKPPARQQPEQEQPPSEQQQQRPSNSEPEHEKNDKVVISHSRNSSDSSGYHEASVLSDNPDNGGLQPRLPETLPRRSRMQGILEHAAPRKLAHTSHASKSLGNLAISAAANAASSGLSRGISNTSLNSNGQRKKRAAPPPPIARPLPSSISTQGLERIVDSDESLTSDMELSKPSSDIDLGLGPTGSSKASSDIACHPVHTIIEQPEPATATVAAAAVEPARVVNAEVKPVPIPRKAVRNTVETTSRASLGSCGGDSSASFGLPSLTEDEREEIALAIDSIDQVASAHEADDVFVEDVPEAFRDEHENEQLQAHEERARSCAVISTIPKCDHLAQPLDEQQFEQQRDDQQTPKKRVKVARSQSEMSHFEFGPAEKHARHLTSTNGESFSFALNPNLGEAATRRIEEAVASGKATPMETDILLQKVSDTLSHSLSPPSPPPTPESANVEQSNFAAQSHSVVETVEEHKSTTQSDAVDDIPQTSCDSQESTWTAKQPESEPERLVTSSDEGIGNSSNVTLGSSTSDYVSSTGEDLAVTADWEYQQIPAPPSEFRDENQQSTDNSLVTEQTAVVESEPSTDVVDAVATCPKPPPVQVVNLCEDEQQEQAKKARVINELESKIQSDKPIVEPATVKDELHAPTVAPAENNLSNFTITTYSRKKSLDIFEPMDEQRLYSETRVLSTFATLTRGKSLASDYAEDGIYRPSALKAAQSMERVSAFPLVDDSTDFAAVTTTKRPEMYREKPVHRSKSYITLSSNQKFQTRVNLTDQSKQDQRSADDAPKFDDLAAPNNLTSATTNIVSSAQQDAPSHKQKFAQWRDNFLERHKEPSRETQLQSLQVLKSILPHLQKSQAADNKSSKDLTDDQVSAIKKPIQFRFDERDNSSATEVQLRVKNRVQEPTKRYTYCGPPSVSLGSWSERPSLNVQIKNDTDYKFGGKNSSSGAKTVVNLSASGTADTETVPPIEHVQKEKAKEEESCIDTTPVNFKELTKAFGQSDVRLRPKTIATGRIPQHRHSEYLERAKPEPFLIKQNGSAAFSHFNNHSRNNNAPVPPVKRYTSVVGITNNNDVGGGTNMSNNNASSLDNNATKANFKFANGQAIKSVAPPLKTFGAKVRESVVPKPPTMPIITGVTLKSVNSRPKSGPPVVQADTRDLLLESIRNFGRDKLKSIS